MNRPQRKQQNTKNMFDLPEIIFLSDDEVGHRIFDVLCDHNSRGEIHGSFGVAFEKD